MTKEGLAVAECENVVMRAGECSVTILPQFGGKIASIRVRGRELLQQPLVPIVPRTQAMGFDESDASGWDECLPSVAACEVEFAGAKVPVPDHGDLWRVDWEKAPEQEPIPGSLTLRGQCFSLPLELTRTVRLEEMPGTWRLGLFYKLTNTGTQPAPWSWSAHPLFAVDEGDWINLPNGMHELRLEGSGGGRLGKNGDSVRWPMAKLADGGEADMRLTLAADSGVGDKLFGGPVPAEVKTCWCEIFRPKARVLIRVSFDAHTTPYLGLWLCYGGWPQREGPKQMCVAVEPATAPVDSLAETGHWSRVLAPGESYEWAMIVDVRTL
jgi:galactose mutarotase-like enzyme